MRLIESVVFVASLIALPPASGDQLGFLTPEIVKISEPELRKEPGNFVQKLFVPVDRKVGILAASGKLGLTEAKAEARPLANKICADKGYKHAIDFDIQKPEQTSRVYESWKGEAYYFVRNDNVEGGFEMKLVAMPTKWVFNNPIDAVMTSAFAYGKAIWETHAVGAYEFFSISCRK